MLDEQAILDVLENGDFASVPPGFELTACVQKTKVIGDHIQLEIVLPFPCQGIKLSLAEEIEQEIINNWPQSKKIAIEIKQRLTAYETKAGVPPIAKIKNILAIASGKGGVGKSTTSVNLALALQAEGAKVGILDADIYGPSIPIMLGIPDARPVSEDKKTILPLEAHSIEAMSIGFLVEEKQAMVWRGPMASSALQQIVRDTRWGELDYLIVDLPPGTGDIQLTLSQKIPVTAAVIVTTPQDLALADAKKAVTMFGKVNIPVMGVVENMSTHICSNCGHQEAIFGEGGGNILSEDYDMPLLGQLPLAMSIRQQLDQGKPAVADDPQSSISQTYRQIARNLTANLSKLAKDYSKGTDSIEIKTWSPKS
ncbi:iron-sulfur cluster carrier protein ApbC [Aliikangiella coralliicola]|uniref:Iron-sulfur cluster carrier protein n=1 Tax=Aliikangiella coralliicola TaxID=2592383 RepID=A0A545UDF0_9GAMM|nr:iron-sulfur cluster carrier protein ApbC [Aliikangiella coralliicola]TQV87491.1 iron-sulfur cluster carrier protein ApbC [Aliikangiella coralliicola]